MGGWGDGEMGRWGDGEMGRWGDGEMGRWGDGEMGRWGDGEMGRWGDGEMGIAEKDGRRVPLRALRLSFMVGVMRSFSAVNCSADIHAFLGISNPCN